MNVFVYVCEQNEIFNKGKKKEKYFLIYII